MGIVLFKLFKMFKYILALLLNQIKCQSPNIKELNQQVHTQSKLFWADQFKVFEENGITEEMILGAKKVYFAPDYADKMSGS